jgi:hypothetical protein
MRSARLRRHCRLAGVQKELLRSIARVVHRAASQEPAQDPHTLERLLSVAR